jgi:hypothetical protein
MTRHVRRATLAVVWLLIVAVISVGAAGIVAAMAHLPGTTSRPELTLDGDRAAAPGLLAAQDQLTQLTADVKRLGELGRGALASLVATDIASLDTTVADGQALARSIEDRSAAIRQELELLPGSGPNEAINWSPDTHARRDLAIAAATTTAGLDQLWATLASGAVTATRLTKLLVDHDTNTGQAAALGRGKAQYAAGLKVLDTSDQMIADARALRDALANTVDVSTLTQWLDRNAEYDAALRELFQSLVDSKGKVTDRVKAAFIAERKAQSFLPANTSGLVIILAEIGRGGLNQAVIGIEEARGKLEAALDELSTPADAAGGSPPPDTLGPTDSPGP